MTLIEREVLGRITPQPLPEEVKQTIARVQEALPRTEVMLGGSTAKGTNLAGDFDIDVFVRFDHDGAISDELEAGLNTLFSAVERVHGSRDYFQVQEGPWIYEFVPVLKIARAEEAENVTDVSPLHVGYVQTQLEKRPDLTKDIRLLKQFCKACGIYGAESYIGGFSGHVIELLVLDYNGFEQVLNATLDWKDHVILDPEGQLDDPLNDLNTSKTRCPVILVDPVQPNRNAAAAVTSDVFMKFKERAKSYLQSEQKASFFVITPLDVNTFQEAHPKSHVVVVHLAPLSGKKDVVAAKCAKIVQYLSRLLHEHGFTIDGVSWEYQTDIAIVLFALPEGTLSEEEIVRGPPKDLTSDVIRFEEKYDDVYEQDKRLFARRKRAFRDPEALIRHLLKDPYVTQRVRDARVKR